MLYMVFLVFVFLNLAFFSADSHASSLLGWILALLVNAGTLYV